MVQNAAPSDMSPNRALRIASTAIPDPRRLSRTEFLIESPPLPGSPNSEGCNVKASTYREAVAQRSLLLARYALGLMGLPHHDVQLGRDGTTAADLVNGQINRLARMASGNASLTWQAGSDSAP